MSVHYNLFDSFRGVYEEVKANSYNVWCLQRYRTVNDFIKRSPIPHPFSILADIYRFFKWVRGENKKSLSLSLYAMGE